jgi:enoyl-CoA hydratase/carnithine racemase
MLGEAFGSDEAADFGLVNQIVPAEQLFAFVQSKAERLASLPTEAVRQSKRLLKQPLQMQVQHVLHQELAQFEQLLHSEVCQQALAKFFHRG